MGQAAHLNYGRCRWICAEAFFMRSGDLVEARDVGHKNTRTDDLVKVRTGALERHCDVRDCLTRLYVHLTDSRKRPVLVEAGRSRNHDPPSGSDRARIAKDGLPQSTTSDTGNLTHRHLPRLPAGHTRRIRPSVRPTEKPLRSRAR